MTEFVASNGVNVTPRIDGNGYKFGTETDLDIGVFTGIYADRAEALREYFQAERDNELGRWRWPENPDYVVYPQGLDHDGFRYAMAVYEPTGNAGKWQEGQYSIPVPTHPEHLGILAVEAYFDAHPEPKKPWEDAKPGEVWELSFDGSSTLFIRDEQGWNELDASRSPYFIIGDRITDGRRIYPRKATE